jgi:hypothetical protein
MKYSSRFFLYAPVGVFLILFAIAGVRWWMLASAWSDRLAALNGHEVMPGVTLHFASKSIGGFPFTLETDLNGVSLAIATPAGPTRWTSERFALHALTYGRDEQIFEAAGHQTLEWTGTDGRRRILAFAVGSLRASAIARNGELNRFDLDLIGFGSRDFIAQRLQFHARQSARDRIDLEATAISPRPSAGQCPLLESRLAQIQITAAIDQAAALGPLLGGGEDWQAAMGKMRKIGGGVRALDISVLPQKGVAAAALKSASHQIQQNLAAMSAETLFEISPLTNAICGR